MADTDQIPADSESHNFERCEQCGAPADRDQRYCVNCGTHRRHVPDPAARYMSRVTAQPGSALAAPAGAGFGATRSIGLLGALAISLIPVAAAVGVVIGRSSNNQDAKLIQAYRNQPTTTTQISAAAAGSTSAASARVSSTAKRSKRAKTTKTRTKAAARGSSSTSNGTPAKITGSKVTASQQSAGSAAAKKIQSATGTNYVQSANNLPSSVVVGP